MQVACGRPDSLTGKKTHYCPGCTHGIVHRLIAEVIDELGIREETVGVASVGCSVLSHNYFNIDMQEAAHGRAPAAATGIKRVLPGQIVFTYQGDGDLASIGSAEILHAAARGENITVIFTNNACYGMTGGQMAPTTLPEQNTSTTPAGRNVEKEGYPIRMAEILATLDAPSYIARTSTHNPKHVLQTKKAIKKAFQAQLNGEGFSMVEVLTTCPTNWRMKPVDALKWLENNMLNYFPLKEFK